MSDRKKSLSPLRVSPQPVLKIPKSERTRAAILNAALDFLWSQPFRDMTVNEVMASAGASRAAFYQYFSDLHTLMETLLDMVQEEIFDACSPWVTGVGDPVALMGEALAGLVQVGYERGPFLRAITDAAAADRRFEEAWRQFLGRFDDAASARIEADQEQGLIPDFDPYSVMFALNRLDAYTLISAFGQHPRKEPGPVRDALTQIWCSTLYGVEYLGKRSSQLVRS